MKDNLHLLIPFLGSFLFVGGLIASKSASQRGVSSSAVSLATNLICSIAFIPFWFFGGEVPETNLWWQPIICATLFMVGMAFTYASVSVGDVSVASPVFGIKVLLVTIVLAIATQKMPSNALWIASAMATSGVVIVQWTGVGDAKNTALTILLASLAACCYAVLDVLIQTWSQSWGTGRLLPIMFLIVGLLSLPLLLRIDWKPIRTKAGASVLLLAAILMTGQVISIVGTLSLFGDAARVNIIYATRGLWGVLLAWAIAHRIGGHEAQLTRSVLLQRLGGAILLTSAVIMVIWRLDS